MARYLPLLALALGAFAIGAAWGLARQRARGERSDTTDGASSGFGVLMWVPIGCGIAAVLVAVLHAALGD